MKVILAFAAVCLAVAVAVTVQPTEEFKQYMLKHEKEYTQEELPLRMAAFYHSKERIRQLHLKARRQGFNTKFALNKFSDLLPEEFNAMYKGYKPANRRIPAIAVSAPSAVDVPEAWDWRTKGAVTPVKNQGQCGSCWAFSATEGVESAWILAKKQTLVLAPQEIVDCDQTDAGCNGGDLPTAFAYVKSRGMELEKNYPYTSGESGEAGSCQYNKNDVVAHISGFAYATQSDNETAMQEAMIPHGPLSICVDASSWQDYSGGVITHDCGNQLDHCVQAVGWGTDAGKPYWIIRNSWGTDWGLDGYLWVERNKDLCGVADEATYVLI